MRLKDKVAIVTGGGSGIGRGTAIRFAQEGAKLMITGRRLQPIEDTVNQIVSEGGEACCLSMDVSKSDQVQDMIDQTVAKYGKLDILAYPQCLDSYERRIRCKGYPIRLRFNT